MPFYEYQCVKCGDKFEFFHLDKDDVAKCANCGTKKVKKIPSSFGFGFKGFGTTSTPAPEALPADGSADETPSSNDCSCSSESCSVGES